MGSFLFIGLSKERPLLGHIPDPEKTDFVKRALQRITTLYTCNAQSVKRCKAHFTVSKDLYPLMGKSLVLLNCLM